MEINSEIRAHLPVWRQKLLNILEEVEQERKSKKRKIQIKTMQPCQSEVKPSQRRNMTATEPGYNAFSNNACRRNIKIAENRIGSLQHTQAGSRLIKERKYSAIAGRISGLEEEH